MSTTMTKQELVHRMLDLPAEIATNEEAVLAAHSDVIAAKEVLQLKEDSLLLGNVIDGKNAEIRAAQVRQHTEVERDALNEAEFRLKQAASRLARDHIQFKALRSVTELLKVPV